MVYAGNKCQVGEEFSRGRSQYTCATVSCMHYREGMLARNGKAYMRYEKVL